jgi:hypothetical protein
VPPPGPPQPPPDTSAAVAAQRTTRHRLLELTESQQWVHHVADLDTGTVQTTTLDRPVAPLSRVERLAAIGHVFDPTIFGGPTYRLGPKHPYQASPEGWMEVSRPTYYAPAGDVLWWEPPRDFDPRTIFLGMTFSFSTTPSGRAVASLSLSGHAFAGTTGNLLIQAQLVPFPVYIPVGAAFGAHTVDFTFVPPQRSVDITVALLAGIELLTFTGATFGPAPLVLDPGVLA